MLGMEWWRLVREHRRPASLDFRTSLKSAGTAGPYMR